LAFLRKICLDSLIWPGMPDYHAQALNLSMLTAPPAPGIIQLTVDRW
jgi:hypothetical protein